MVRKHFKITGRVQGVGFRYRAKYAASGMGLTGWVRNEWDGSVEMEVVSVSVISGSSFAEPATAFPQPERSEADNMSENKDSFFIC